MFGIGAGEFALILIVGLIVFGPSKLPELGRSLGKLLREFRKAQAALSNVVSEVDQAPVKPSTATRSETVTAVNQVAHQEEPITAQATTSNDTNSPAPPTPSIEQVTEMINANPIKLTKEPVER
ncbi:MAG: twin-arginine translocase TatA/TatE family subunit [Selenomonadaceae bacterium]|nr:twin-arginine translocase TatA/TatE family subunit [Selenomonadaceae bacterium]